MRPAHDTRLPPAPAAARHRRCAAARPRPRLASCGARPCATRASCWRMLGLDSAGRSRVRRGGGPVPAARAARLRRAHAPRRSAPTRCCGRCCRWTTRCAPCPASRWTRWATSRPRAGHGRDPQVPRPRPAGRHRQLRGALPLLLPPPLPLRRGDRRRATAGARRSTLIARRPDASTRSSSPAATRWSLATPKLAELTEALAALPHLRRLRIHTRLPIVLPERVDAALLAWLARPALAGRRWCCTPTTRNEFDAGVDAALAPPARTRARRC